MVRAAALAVPTCIVLALAGCGSGEALETKSGPPLGASQLVSAAVSALDGVHSYHVQAAGTQNHQSVDFAADVQLPGRVRVTLRIGDGAELQMIAIDTLTYVNGNASYWALEGIDGRTAALLGDRWVRLTTAQRRSLPGMAGFAAMTRPASAGLCGIGPNFGSVAVVGHASIDGRAAVAISLAADAPGSFRGTLYVAASGSPLPLREVQTSPNRAGGSTICGPLSQPGTEDDGTVDFTRFNAPLSISPPQGVVNEPRTVAGVHS